MRLILARIIFRFDLELCADSDFAPEKQKVHFFWAKPELKINVYERQ
jgi:hypothetical protein